MNPYLLLAFVAGYFLLLLGVAWYTSRNSNNESFFIGNRNSNWMLVAFGMIGTSLSGVTFVSVPGAVGTGAFNYFQIVIGYFIGYMVIAFVLLPLYYKMNLTSIYKYLESRFGVSAHKTGAFFFILSRTLGATARLYLVINILQIFIFDSLRIPFVVTAGVILLMILLYTFEGGVKTIIYTDTLQTTGMLLGLVISIVAIMNSLGYSFSETLQELKSAKLSQIFNGDINSPAFFVKQILGGAVITIAMTGLDQEMMQKNISVNNLRNSQKNMMSFTAVLVVVNFLFLLLGGLLYLYAAQNNITAKGDDLFPTIALQSTFSSAISIIFIIALISALFPSVDGAITALTSSFCIDILGLKNNDLADAKLKKALRYTVIAGIVFLLLLILVALALAKSYDAKTTTNLMASAAIIAAAGLFIAWFAAKARHYTGDPLRKRSRLTVHFIFAAVFFMFVVVFKMIDEKNIIDFIIKIAGFTYGPLLGLFAFGILTRKAVNSRYIATVCISALLLTCCVDILNNPAWYEAKFGIKGPFIEQVKVVSVRWFHGYKIGPELLLINGLFTFAGLWFIALKKPSLYLK